MAVTGDSTLPHTADADPQELQASPKDADEHRLAVESVVSELSKIARIEVGPTHVLTLCLMFCALPPTSVPPWISWRRRCRWPAHSIPTAALGGTPRLRALETIAEVEGIDRDRYSAPVGWMDTRGGEWCIALRCARIDGTHATAWAGRASWRTHWPMPNTPRRRRNSPHSRRTRGRRRVLTLVGACCERDVPR